MKQLFGVGRRLMAWLLKPSITIAHNLNATGILFSLKSDYENSLVYYDSSLSTDGVLICELPTAANLEDISKEPGYMSQLLTSMLDHTYLDTVTTEKPTLPRIDCGQYHWLFPATYSKPVQVSCTETVAAGSHSSADVQRTIVGYVQAACNQMGQSVLLVSVYASKLSFADADQLSSIRRCL